MKHDAFVPASDLTKLWRALIEFNMIEEGDKILIGLSGGKDSMFLTAALAEIQKHSPRHFDLLCYTMDGMFAEDFPKKNWKTSAAPTDSPIIRSRSMSRPSGAIGQHPVLFLCLLPPGRDEPQSPRTWLQQDCPGPSQ